MKIKFSLLAICLFFILCQRAFSQEQPLDNTAQSLVSQAFDSNTIFDDKMLIEGYTKKYKNLPKHIFLEMIKDFTLNPYETTAAISVFRNKFSSEVVGREKLIFEKFLLRRLNLDDSPFVQIEIAHSLCILDRYKYFKSMVPLLIQKLEHYNQTINEIAYEAIDDIIKKGNDRAREASIIFNALRKILFLTHKRLANVSEPDARLSQKLNLIRWSIKILGTQQIKKLPKEVINLL